jgi:hypothetical protein
VWHRRISGLSGHLGRNCQVLRDFGGLAPSLVISWLLLLVLIEPVHAWNSSVQAHGRSGWVSRSYSGVVKGGVSGLSSLSLELESIESARVSYFFQTNFLYQIEQAKIPYLGIGAGVRTYLSGGVPVYDYSEMGSANRVTSTARLRTYVDLGVGLAQAEVKTFGSVLSTQSTLLEFRPDFGLIWPLSKSYALEFQVGLLLGLGISTVSVSATGFQTLVGGVYWF